MTPFTEADTCVIFLNPTCPATLTNPSQRVTGCGACGNSRHCGASSGTFGVASCENSASDFLDLSYGGELLRNFASGFLDALISSGRINRSPGRIAAA